MTTTNGGPGAPQPQQQQAPALNVLGQYIKDFSFENPNAPRSLAPSETQPAINIAINVGVQQLGQTEYEVSLKLEGRAENSGTVLFAFDLTFAGMFIVFPISSGLAVYILTSSLVGIVQQWYLNRTHPITPTNKPIKKK